MKKIRIDLAEQIAKKSEKENRKITLLTLKGETNLSYNTIKAYANNFVQRPDLETLAALCNYFDCTVGDLLRLEECNTA